MSSRTTSLRLFAEDTAHESFVQSVVRRIAREEDVATIVHTGSAVGGAGRALKELKLHQRLVSPVSGEVLVAVIDANCKGWADVSRDIRGTIDTAKFPAWVIACPDPHVERWYLADPTSLENALGVHITPMRYKCERARYKAAFTHALRAAGHVVRLGGAEFAEDVVEAMDLYEACKADASLRHFVDDLRSALRRTGGPVGEPGRSAGRCTEALT
ncbi:MAG: hypothetical protein HY815_15750 [Candidatus Riflebacteria bacterium]|nr:hypothetical protein [Candidatus Riflebacteria bacterium]